MLGATRRLQAPRLLKAAGVLANFDSQDTTPFEDSGRATRLP